MRSGRAQFICTLLFFVPALVLGADDPAPSVIAAQVDPLVAIFAGQPIDLGKAPLCRRQNASVLAGCSICVIPTCCCNASGAGADCSCTGSGNQKVCTCKDNVSTVKCSYSSNGSSCSCTTTSVSSDDIPSEDDEDEQPPLEP